MIPWILIRSVPCHPVKEKGHRVDETVASSAVEQIFIVTAMHAKAMASNHLAKANRASHGQRVSAKDIVQKVMENPKENPKVTMVPKVRTRVKTSKKGFIRSGTPEIRDKFRNSGICTNVSH